MAKKAKMWCANNSQSKKKNKKIKKKEKSSHWGSVLINTTRGGS